METNWKILLDAALTENGESWEQVQAYTMNGAEMTQMFDSGYGVIGRLPLQLLDYVLDISP